MAPGETPRAPLVEHALGPALATEEANEAPAREHRRLLVGGVACAGLALVALALLAHRVPYFSFDLTITRDVQGMRAGWIDSLLRPLNALGFAPFVGITYGAIILLIFAVRARWEAVAATFATLGAAGLTPLVKAIVARPRPSIDLVHVEHHLAGSGFPAGHVVNFTALVGFLCYLTWVRFAPSWPRTTLIAILVMMIGLMGIARIHAGEHWPSDVLGGYLLGIVWLVAAVEFYRWGKRRGRARTTS